MTTWPSELDLAIVAAIEAIDVSDDQAHKRDRFVVHLEPLDEMQDRERECALEILGIQRNHELGLGCNNWLLRYQLQVLYHDQANSRATMLDDSVRIIEALEGLFTSGTLNDLGDIEAYPVDGEQVRLLFVEFTAAWAGN